MPSNIRAIIWDMGGVLLRTDDSSSRTQLARKYNLTLEELNKLVFAQEVSYLASLGKATEDDIWNEVAKKLSLDKKDLGEFLKMFWAGDNLDRGLIDFIRSLRPEFRTGLLSNAWLGTRRTLTETYKCIDAFDSVVISAEIGIMKPDPRIFDLILRQMKVKANQAIFVDDTLENVTAAKSNRHAWNSIHES